jgi:hypothetical protein
MPRGDEAGLGAFEEAEGNAESQLDTENHPFDECRTPILCRDVALQQGKLSRRW